MTKPNFSGSSCVAKELIKPELHICSSFFAPVCLVAQTVLDTMKSLRQADNVEHPGAKDLRRTAERFGVRTVYGNYNFVSTVKNRSAGLTVYVGSLKVIQRQTNAKQLEILSKASETIAAVD